MLFGKPFTFKPLSVTGIILILVMLIGACDSDSPSEETGNNVEYTDVEYSEDGSGVTLYLDGVGVPKSRAQRAVTKDLAQTAFDFIEIIFVSPSGTARTSWILGQPANIVGVPGKTGTTSVNYNSISTTPAACMFVGRDDGKVLLGVGKLTGTKGTTTTTNTATTVDVNTTSVTFSLSALQSGLIVGGETTSGTGAAVDSFTYTGRDATNSFRKILPPVGGVGYPVYLFPNYGSTAPNTTSDDATYTFSFTANSAECITAIKHINTTTVYPVVQKKTPRYATNGRYEEPRNRIDTYTTVAFRDTYAQTPTHIAPFAPANGGNFVAAVPLRFTKTANSSGLFAFNIQIPVYMVSATTTVVAGSLPAVTWFIRTGVGSEFYSLDDGVSRGGCVLISVGVSSSDFSSIEWTWFKGF